MLPHSYYFFVAKLVTISELFDDALHDLRLNFFLVIFYSYRQHNFILDHEVQFEISLPIQYKINIFSRICNGVYLFTRLYHYFFALHRIAANLVLHPVFNDS